MKLPLNGSELYKGSATISRATFTNPADSDLNMLNCGVQIIFTHALTGANLGSLSIGTGLVRETNTADLQEIKVTIPANFFASVNPPATILFFCWLTVGGTPITADHWNGSFRLKSAPTPS